MDTGAGSEAGAATCGAGGCCCWSGRCGELPWAAHRGEARVERCGELRTRLLSVGADADHTSAMAADTNNV